MSAIGTILIILGLIGTITNGVQLYHFYKIQNDIRNEISDESNEFADELAPFAEHSKSQFVFSIAIIGVGLFILLR